MKKSVGNITLIVIIVVVCFVVVKSGYCQTQGVVISSAGDYLFINTADYRVSERLNLKESLNAESSDANFKNILRKVSIYDVFEDVQGNRLFISIGQGQENKMYGFLIFQLTPFKFIRFVELEMALGPIGFFMYHKGNVLILSYVKGNESVGYKTTTAAFNAQSYELVKEYSNRLFKISRKNVCLINDELYINNKYFISIYSGSVIREEKLDTPLWCEDGHSLAILSNDSNAPAVLSLYDLASKPRSKKEIRTGEHIDSINSEEWYVTRKGEFIVREEWRKGKGRTGRLVFFDAKKDKKKELKLAKINSHDKGIIGFSLSGDLLFYNSDNMLNIVNVVTQQIYKQIQLPFNPIAVVWP